MTDSGQTYNFSYTGFSLRISETSIVAEARLSGREFDAIKEIAGGKTSTAKNFLNEINKRLETLTKAQLHLLAYGTRTQQKQIALLAVCKVHHFIRDFVIEVLREKMLVFDNLLSEGEYISFIRRKADLHPEIEEMTEVSQKKIKQVTFKILEQAGLIDNSQTKIIQPQILDSETIRAIVSDDKNWLQLFFWSDMDIKNIST